MAWRGEVEDGLGWGGLVASKSEQREEARLAALERDAARYRWLRDRAENPWPVNSPEMVRLYIIERGPTLDQAIDAAMAAEGRA